MKKPFDGNMYFTMLQKMVSPPPSDDLMDAQLVHMIKSFIKDDLKTSVEIWNFYKHLLDLTVRYALGSGFIVKLLDLEPFYEPPNGGYNSADSSMDNAPWRLNEQPI